MPEPEAIEAVRQFRNRLLALDGAASRQLIDAYGPIFGRLSGRIDALLAEIQGKQMSFNQVLRLRRFQALQAQILSEINGYARAAGKTITDAQRAAVGLAQQSTRATAEAALPRGINLRVLSRVGIEWNTLPTQAFEGFIGVAGDGAPLGRLLAPLGAEVRAGVTEAVGEGIALGRGPRETARQVRNKFGLGLTRSLRISRTETLRAHREATRLQYAANPNIVKGYRRLAAKQINTCMACIALDGKHYEVDEPLDEHVSGRCVLVPEVVSYQDLGLPVIETPRKVENAREWFGDQSAGTQQDMMGPGAHKAWKGGQFGLQDMAKVTTDPTWGAQATVKPLKELVR